MQVGIRSPMEISVSVDICPESDSSVLVPESAKGTVTKKMKKPHLLKTTETQNLSTAELQRLVLWEQLEILRLKKRKLLRELEQVSFLVMEIK